MQILILAGGRGTRLQPLTHETPKPLLPLAGRPILTRIVEGLSGENPVTVLITPELEVPFRRWRDTLPAERPVQLYVEPRREGPSGPLIGISDCVREQAIDDDVLLLMGDSIHPFSLTDFLFGGPTGQPRVAAYRLSDVRDASRFGVIEIGPEDQVKSFEEKPPRPRSPWVFTGCVSIPARLLPFIQSIAATSPPQVGCLIAAFVEMGEEIGVHRASGVWHDIGTPESYLAAHAEWFTPLQRTSVLQAGNTLEGDVYIAPCATVSGTRVANSIVGEGSQIIDSDIENCVIEGGTEIMGRTLRNLLVSRRGETPLLRTQKETCLTY